MNAECGMMNAELKKTGGRKLETGLRSPSEISVYAPPAFTAHHSSFIIHHSSFLRRGFTLVELLVVLLIISILAALLLPAIQSARESARATQCINYQGELAKAIISYNNIKKHLPGVFNPNPSDPAYANPSITPSVTPFTNWVMTIFNDLGRMDLWQDWQDGAGTPVKVGQLICPSNTMINPIGGLSYIVNLGGYASQIALPGTPDYSQRLFRNRIGWDAILLKVEPDISLDTLKSSSRTVMLSECLTAGPWTYTPSTVPIAGDPLVLTANTSTSVPFLAFQWPKSGSNNSTLVNGPSDGSSPVISGPYLSSFHRGYIVVTFCGGNVEKISETTFCWPDPNIDPDNTIRGVP